MSNFISKWNTILTSSGSSSSHQVKLPLESTGTYDFLVVWGDGTQDRITRWNQGEVQHTYPLEGIYTITINGTLIGWRFNNGGDKLKIIEISQWGEIRLGNSTSYFLGSTNLKLVARDALNLNGTTTLYQAFAHCTSLGHTGNMSKWDVSAVTNMYAMFREASSFNQPIGTWDVSNTTNMQYMFRDAVSFNQSIAEWNVSKVTNMQYMFQFALSFNQPIGDWDVSDVLSMGSMFNGASSFNQPLGNWNVSGVTLMNFMMHDASSFNQPVGDWNVSATMFMYGMFLGVTFTTANYDNLLVSWSALSLQTGIIFHGGNSYYSNTTARQYIIDTFDWTIIDQGYINDSLVSSEKPSSQTPMIESSRSASIGFVTSELGTNILDSSHKNTKSTSLASNAPQFYVFVFSMLLVISVRLQKNRSVF
ncbi:MAG: DUF285 domain-containing protein [Candidatus Heimdallarchaeota archaeon]|nr:DUF285 domain-containing protein [Candidatus Heimdallarchaeota archaeon]